MLPKKKGKENEETSREREKEDRHGWCLRFEWRDSKKMRWDRDRGKKLPETQTLLLVPAKERVLIREDCSARKLKEWDEECVMLSLQIREHRLSRIDGTWLSITEKNKEEQAIDAWDWPTMSRKRDPEANWPSLFLASQVNHPSSSMWASITMRVPFANDLSRRERGRSVPSSDNRENKKMLPSKEGHETIDKKYRRWRER